MALKTLEELNRDFLSERAAYRGKARNEHLAPSAVDPTLQTVSVKPIIDITGFDTQARAAEGKSKSGKRSTGVFTFISNMIFYLAIILIMLTVLTSGTENGATKTVFGYSYFTVVSKSMQDEIPKGSFILVKNSDPKDLKVGDTITYMRDRSTSVTHKVLEIYENYNNSGARGFQTMGVNNTAPDSDIVYESSVVGKVVTVIPALGAMLSGLASNVYLVFIIFGLCVVMSLCIRGLLAKPEKRRMREAEE